MRRAVALAALATACASAPSLRIEPLAPGTIPPGRSVTAFNVEAELARGRFLEVGEYLSRLSASEARRPSQRALAGRVALARGDSPAARAELSAALAGEIAGRERAEAEWALAQADLLTDDFAAAAEHAGAATRQGLFLSPGFVRFLEAVSGQPPYAGVASGERVETGFEMGLYDLVQVPATVNGNAVAAVLDTGASYCILTRSFATAARVREIPRSDAYGLGFHGKPIPLTFGVVEALSLGGRELAAVPVMIMPDEALSFDTARGPLPISAVLGLHFLKNFALEIDYARRRLVLERRAPQVAPDAQRQNLFYARNKVFVRTSVEGLPWTLFLLDSGSELTMLTAQGIQRLGLRTATGVPRRVAGIGKSRVSWGKVSHVALGVADYRLLFRDMVVAETEEGLEDGVLGATALVRFRVRVDFPQMRLELAEPAPTP